MRKILGVLLMLLGIALVLGSGVLALTNRQQEQTANAHTQAVLPVLRAQIRQVHAADPAIQPVPEEHLLQEDFSMTEKVINGYGYIGTLTIAELGLELPVMSEGDSQRLQIAPCRYTGSTRGENLVIMAHNYGVHFGNLSRLSVGSQVQFADMDGQIWNYRVAAMDVLAAEAVEEMTDGAYDLTLFTCAANRTHRVTVRCNRIEEME